MCRPHGHIHLSEGLGIVFHGNYNGPPMTAGDLEEVAKFMKGQEERRSNA